MAHDWRGPEDRMPEAEVAIRLAEYMTGQEAFGGTVDVAIDGASVAVGGSEVFDIRGYMRAYGWEPTVGTATGRNEWTAHYVRGGALMRIHSRSGLGDVAAVIGNTRVVAECKKGPLVKKPGSPEYPLLTTAIGQALLFRADPTDILVAAVPDTPAFRRIAADWRERPRLKASGIRIALVNRSGAVTGLDLG